MLPTFCVFSQPTSLQSTRSRRLQSTFSPQLDQLTRDRRRRWNPEPQCAFLHTFVGELFLGFEAVVKGRRRDLAFGGCQRGRGVIVGSLDVGLALILRRIRIIFRLKLVVLATTNDRSRWITQHPTHVLATEPTCVLELIVELEIDTLVVGCRLAVAADHEVGRVWPGLR